MPEFRKLFDLPAAKLSREDVENLAKVITDGIASTRPDYLSLSLSSGDATYKARSIDELLSQELPASVDNLDFSVAGVTSDYNIDRGVTIHLHRLYSTCQVHALDEIWFNGKIEQITKFFRNRRTWYGKFRNFFPFLFGVILTASFFVFSFLVNDGEIPLALVAGATFVVFLFSFLSFINGQLFAHINIQLTQKLPLVTRETLTILLMVTSTIATVVGVVVQLMSNAKL